MLDYLQANKEWIFSGIGVFLIGFLIKLWAAGLSPDRLTTRYQHRLKRYVGHYESFQEVMDGFFVKSAVAITYSWPAQLRVEFRSRQWTYKGKLDLEETIMSMALMGVRHYAHAIFLFKDPPGNFDVLSGVYAGSSTTRLPIAGRIILHRISEATYKTLECRTLSRSDLPESIKCVFDKYRQDAIVIHDLERYTT